MAKHKWHKEIKHWADGGEIELRFANRKQHSDEWTLMAYACWDDNAFEFRIKLQPKEPQYLYAWLNKDDETIFLDVEQPNKILEDALYKYIGKVPLITEAK